MQSRIFSASEILSNVERLHSPEEFGIGRKHVFKSPMSFAGLFHQDAAAFLDDLRIDDARPIPERSNRRSALKNRINRFPIAAWTKGLSSSRHTQSGCRSLPALQKQPRCPFRHHPLPFWKKRYEFLRSLPRDIRERRQRAVPRRGFWTHNAGFPFHGIVRSTWSEDLTLAPSLQVDQN